MRSSGIREGQCDATQNYIHQEVKNKFNSKSACYNGSELFMFACSVFFILNFFLHDDLSEVTRFEVSTVLAAKLGLISIFVFHTQYKSEVTNFLKCYQIFVSILGIILFLLLNFKNYTNIRTLQV